MKKNSKLQWSNVQQNSEEWFSQRLGKITGSMFGTVMANKGKAFGDPAKRYAERIALERITGTRIETYSNDYMQRGHELEPIAREFYELETFSTVNDGGFFFIENIGVSPDGIVDDGLIEIKSVVYNTHFERLRKGGIDNKYRWQIQGALWITKKQFVDFISFCPEMPENKKLYILRVYPDEEMFNELDIRIREFEKLVQENIKLLTK